VIGGTGDQGFGLALRWAKAGYEVIIGSRSQERAQEASKKVNDAIGHNVRITGLANPDATKQADIVVLSVPFEGFNEIFKAIKPFLREGQLVVSVIVPLESSIAGKPTRTIGLWDGSAAEYVNRMLPKNLEMVAAFNNVSAEKLHDLNGKVDCDVLICGNKEENRKKIFELVTAIPGARPIDAGPLENSRTIEQVTALLVSLNIRHNVKGAGIRITGLPG
jgi:8-hydroxy-5-deazaflavin:NADPH oxidoreductase